MERQKKIDQQRESVRGATGSTRWENVPNMQQDRTFLDCVQNKDCKRNNSTKQKWRNNGAFFLGPVCTDNSADKRWHIDLLICGKILCFKIDTGADITVMSHSLYLSLPMQPVVKKNRKVYICMDLKRLNETVRRERFIFPKLEDVAPTLSGVAVFSTLDASSGF